MFLVDARPHKIDDGDVVPRLTSRTESMAEHEPERCLKHGFIGLLQTSFLVESEYFVGRGQLLLRACEKICAQSMACGFSFFIWDYERNMLIVPNVFQKGILPGAARLQFLRG